MKRYGRIACLFLAMFALLLLAGCGKSADKAASGENFAVIKDDLGRDVTLPKKPERIVVLSASFLEPLHAVGGDVVGRPDSKNGMPDWAKDKASIGEVYNIDMEKVLSLSPDLVLVLKGVNDKLLPELEQNNIPTLVLDVKSYDDVKREVHTLAEVTGEKDKGDALVADMDKKVQAVIDKIPKDKKRVAILHSTSQGLSVQLDGSIAGSIAKGLGWENVASGLKAMDKNPDAAPYSLETLVQENPEIVFITSMGKIDEIKKSMQAQISSSPAWQSIPAIQKGAVYYLPQNLFLLSPGLRYPEAFETMAKLVYPDAFKDDAKTKDAK